MASVRPRPTLARPLPSYRLWLRYSDGAEGEVDPSDLAGKGVLAVWNDVGQFERVHLAEHGRVEWDGEVDLCPDALYLRLTNKRPDEVFPNLAELHVRA